MAKEEFSIRITRKGEIFVECEGMTPRRVKNLAELLEETLGPVEIREEGRPEGGPGQVHIDDHLDEGLDDDEKERERVRGG